MQRNGFGAAVTFATNSETSVRDRTTGGLSGRRRFALGTVAHEWIRSTNYGSGGVETDGVRRRLRPEV
jgi:hypothetical protein